MASEDNPRRGRSRWSIVCDDRALQEESIDADIRHVLGLERGTDVLELRQRGHTLTMDAAWLEFADDCLVRFEKQGW